MSELQKATLWITRDTTSTLWTEWKTWIKTVLCLNRFIAILSNRSRIKNKRYFKILSTTIYKQHRVLHRTTKIVTDMTDGVSFHPYKHTTSRVKITLRFCKLHFACGICTSFGLCVGGRLPFCGRLYHLYVCTSFGPCILEGGFHFVVRYIQVLA